MQIVAMVWKKRSQWQFQSFSRDNIVHKQYNETISQFQSLFSSNVFFWNPKIFAAQPIDSGDTMTNHHSPSVSFGMLKVLPRHWGTEASLTYAKPTRKVVREYHGLFCSYILPSSSFFNFLSLTWPLAVGFWRGFLVFFIGKWIHAL